ncbi:MAG: lysophospholipid acyltransferase family protein [Alphaproteobacteria bacterium]|nr:lysophospholipid acyltransferase family protein [Alphaproteobacteria bacterium]
MFRKIWKAFWEPILRLSIFQWVIALVMAGLIWFVYFTCRKEIVNYKTFKKYRHKPAIFVFWHGRSMMLSPIVCLGGMKSYAIASLHKDGKMMAKLQHLFGLRAIYGSSHNGGLSVLRNGIKVLRRGDHSLCISPDGPGGPSLRVQDGALYFAKMSGAPIIPVCFSARHTWIQRRWDRYLLVYPFTKIKCKVGEPMFVDSKISEQEFESKRQELEDIMVKQLRELDAEFNLYYVEQDFTAAEFKKAKRQGKEPKLTKRYK